MNRSRRRNEARIQLQRSGRTRCEPKAPSWNRCAISVDPLRVRAPAAEAGYLLPSALFSEHLRLFEHGGSHITPTCRSLSSQASFGAFLLIPLYGNQSTSNPNHLSRRYTRLSFLCVGLRDDYNFKELEVAPLNDEPFNSSALAARRSRWLRRTSGTPEAKKGKKKRRGFTSSRQLCRAGCEHGWDVGAHPSRPTIGEKGWNGCADSNLQIRLFHKSRKVDTFVVCVFLPSQLPKPTWAAETLCVCAAIISASIKQMLLWVNKGGDAGCGCLRRGKIKWRVPDCLAGLAVLPP